MNKKLILFVTFLTLFLASCTEAGKVSHNISKEADNFNVVRRVAVINTRTDKDKYKKHIVKLTNWNMYVVEDLEGAAVDQYKYEINYMPESILPFKITESK